MPKKRTVLTEKRRGPAPTGKGTLVGVRLQPLLLKALDKFIKNQDGKPSRPEAVRMILTDALITYGALPVEAPPPMKRDAN